eukprot:CAMPEP_0179027266 /NCGR_PEP_ID=MMETSP0796-20121207/8949_1 /TAXON_ID=73915 /ORGANISM="Pyrodinium bahamense, Strain pbaha01" /LENGTH=68 /DNA_ID=CAMNT_0020723387 /DNA_START=150 /DNA_END=353 /DNA_ORIENTATION=+
MSMQSPVCCFLKRLPGSRAHGWQEASCQLHATHGHGGQPSGDPHRDGGQCGALREVQLHAALQWRRRL